MQNELRHQVALSMIPGIGPVHAKLLLEKLGDASSIFKTKKYLLERIEGIGAVRAAAIGDFDSWQAVEEEMAFMERYRIQPLFLTDERYPRRLLHCYAPPTLLYYSGRADLNAERMVAIVGTRYKSDYGHQLTEAVVAGLAPYGVTVVSGLALGIDAVAHKAALGHSIPTIGVLGHRLDSLYPAEHKGMAKTMLAQGGGLLTEFRKGTGPDRHNFPLRNRVVAGMCDAVVVVESGLKGGSMITASLAFDYDREVFAFPGKTTDARSAGANQLIRTQRATLLTSAEEIATAMRWEPLETAIPSRQRAMPAELSGEEQRIVQLLQSCESLPLEAFNMDSGLNAGQVASSLLSLELRQVLRVLPGKRYALNYN